MPKIPPYLRKGDTIGLVAPAGYMPPEDFQQCIQTLHDWGFRTLPGKTPGNQFHYFSGTDDERTNDLQEMMDNPAVNAILCVRGGYGVGRIIERLDFKKFTRKPKWLIGFSDITVLHSHILTNCRVATLHAPMAAAFNDGKWQNEPVQSLRKALTGKKGNYKTASHPDNRSGMAEGVLVGGNLALLAHLVGTSSDIDTKNKILFIEDTGEYIYNIDRMMTQLKRAGKLDKLNGLVIGSFNNLKDTIIPFGMPVEDVIKELVAGFSYPVCFHFPVGHQDQNYALKIGVKYKLKVGSGNVTLKEQ